MPNFSGGKNENLHVTVVQFSKITLINSLFLHFSANLVNLGMAELEVNI